MNTPPIIIICGPTGVGKSDFAEQLAQQVSGEIVNMDLGQFYTPLSIGTAKPDWANAKVSHHLFDILDTPKNFTVVEYRQRLLETCNELFKRDVMPVVVGGSLFYLKSLFFPPMGDSVNNAPSDTQHSSTWEELQAIDPDRAAVLHKNDTYRINRAMEIWRSKGIKPSLYHPMLELPHNVILLYLTRNRDDLYARIDKRVIMMMQAGWLDEVRLLDKKWELFLHEKKLIGYNELLHYLNTPGDVDFEEIIRIIQQRSRHYAKRQETFWRGFERALNTAYQQVQNPQCTLEIDSVNLTLCDVDLYIKQLLDRLKNR